VSEATPPPTTAPEPLCELRHVHKAFQQGKGAPLRVLEDVSIAVRPREVVALLGPSGCGKSTILRILAGLTPPSAGEVLYHGAPLEGLNPGIGFVFQSFALFPWMTVAQNVEAVLRAQALPPDEVAARSSGAIRCSCWWRQVLVAHASWITSRSSCPEAEARSRTATREAPSTRGATTCTVA
jgi:NitT/TauT family transport system ATP-binding protein